MNEQAQHNKPLSTTGRSYLTSYAEGDTKCAGCVEAESWSEAQMIVDAKGRGERVIGLSEESVLMPGRYLNVEAAFQDGLANMYLNKNGSVVYRLWDILRAAVGGADREKLTGCKRQVHDIVAEHVHQIADRTLQDDGPFVELEPEAFRKNLRTLFYSHTALLCERLRAFARFALEERQFDFWEVRVDRILSQDADKWFSWVMDDTLKVRDELIKSKG